MSRKRTRELPTKTEKPQAEQEFDRHFDISWSVRRVIDHLPTGLGDKKTVLRIVEKVMRFEHGDLWTRG
jgi:hypothetical protein